MNLSHCLTKVYKISCEDCDISYVGQKRKLNTRLHEHISDIKKKTDSSVMYF